MLDIRDFGAVCDGVCDDGPAIRSAIAASRQSHYASYGSKIVLPAGRIRVVGDIVIDCAAQLVGEGAGSRSRNTDVLMVDGGVIVEGSAQGGASQRYAQGALIEGVCFSAQRGNPSIGIQIRASSFTLRSVSAFGFGSHGIFVDGRASVGPHDEPIGYPRNADFWELHRVLVENCGGWGVLARGADSQAGSGSLVSTVSNGLGGIGDRSHLGNHWSACHSAANRGPQYAAYGQADGSEFVSCYAEREGPGAASVIAHPCVVLGGNLPSSWHRLPASQSEIDALRAAGHTSLADCLTETTTSARPPFFVKNRLEVGGFRMRVPGATSTRFDLALQDNAPIAIQREGIDQYETGLKIEGDFVHLCRGGYTSQSVAKIRMDGGQAATRPISIDLPRGVAVSGQRIISAAIPPTMLDGAAPVSGTVCFNSRPSAGGFLCWVYVGNRWVGCAKIEDVAP